MKKISIFFILLFTGTFLAAQAYDTGIGIRLGTEWGLTVQQRIAKKTTLEGILQHNNKRDETGITLLAEQHYPILIRNVNIYVGGGLHKGWVAQNEEVGYKDPFGVTLIGGAEASLGRINVSWDFKPAINVVGGERTVYTETAISIRYVIDKRKIFGNNKEKKKRQKERDKKKRQKAKDKKRGNDSGDDWKFWKDWFDN
jgi:hypothetical protein